mgnify:FL=1
MKQIIISLISSIIPFLSFLLALLTFKKKIINKTKEEGVNEGLILSDIRYIKESVNRLEKTFTKADEDYRKLEIRITKLEEKMRKENE